jgi:hypothetical protein
MNAIDKDICITEIDLLIKWQEDRKKWHNDKTRQKMAAEGTSSQEGMPGVSAFKSSDFGLHEVRKGSRGSSFLTLLT